MKNRIEHLDGLRGLAILLVLFYHIFSRWTDRLPYGDEFSLFIFKHGWIGVQLFFLISGFVILMTLERTQTIKKFLFKRWLRLFPAMLIASLLIYVTAQFLSDRPAGDPTLRSLVPGLSFISSAIWNNYLNITMPTMEGAFWSLYVEAYFYVFIAFVYFKLTSNKITECILFIYLCSFIYCRFLAGEDIQEDPIRKFIEHIGFLYYGWFAAGMAFYNYMKSKNEKWFIAGLIIAVFSSITLRNIDIGAIIYAVITSLIFALSFKIQALRTALSFKIFTFLGFISYPLYLIHENASISMIIAIGRAHPDLPNYLHPLLPIVIVILTAYVITKWLEPKLRIVLNHKFSRFFKSS
ncbi:acyltransferase [Paraglaciecola sp. L3A3]|uniref:acyltransferase family protein n=1 Tax=Paraglaciecola sp. L3A3 TaxID=2686358 RepID=UPI00131CC6F3|nr:acyltransferase [Paraglaciecola sp. L3A3]